MVMMVASSWTMVSLSRGVGLMHSVSSTPCVHADIRACQTVSLTLFVSVCLSVINTLHDAPLNDQTMPVVCSFLLVFCHQANVTFVRRLSASLSSSRRLRCCWSFSVRCCSVCTAQTTMLCSFLLALCQLRLSSSSSRRLAAADGCSASSLVSVCDRSPR